MFLTAPQVERTIAQDKATHKQQVLQVVHFSQLVQQRILSRLQMQQVIQVAAHLQ